MNLSKSHEYFQPEKLTDRIHIVGCGSVGSTIAENLARCGIKKFSLWDFDVVEEKNIVNQMFLAEHVGKKKTEALADIICRINPEAASEIELHDDGWNNQLLNGFIFLCVDSIAIRKAIVERHFDSPFVKAVFDVRTGLEDAQSYAADWHERKQRQILLDSMQFSDDEAKDATPVSACGITLGVATTVRIISAYAVDNFLNFVRKGELKKFISADGFSFVTDAC